MASNIENGKSAWSEEQLELAKMFRKSCGLASRSIWEAAEHAATARLTFPKRTVNAEKSFARYAIEQLERDPSTVSEWLLGLSYCKKYEPQRLLDGKCKLPPISMFSKLVAIRPERRLEFHEKLFGPIGGMCMTASEFRRELESLKHPELSDDGTQKTKKESNKNYAIDSRSILQLRKR